MESNGKSLIIFYLPASDPIPSSGKSLFSAEFNSSFFLVFLSTNFLKICQVNTASNKCSLNFENSQLTISVQQIYLLHSVNFHLNAFTFMFFLLTFFFIVSFN